MAAVLVASARLQREAQMYSMYEASMPLVVSLGEQASIPYQVWLSGGRSPLRSSPLGSSPLSRGHKGEIAPLSSLDHYPLGQSPFVSRMELLRSEEREDSNDEHKEHKLNLTVSSNVTFYYRCGKSCRRGLYL